MKKLMRLAALVAIVVLTGAASPYSGITERPIKALPAERIQDLRNGSGAGYALAAELNGYPGPRHVLELAAELKLSEDQLSKTRDLFSQMSQEAIALGITLIEREGELDAVFREGRANESNLIRLTSAIASTDGALRAAHLKYHLEMSDVLNEQQRKLYGVLRGYSTPGTSHGGHKTHNR
jgi:hypothetical protein